MTLVKRIVAALITVTYFECISSWRLATNSNAVNDASEIVY